MIIVLQFCLCTYMCLFSGEVTLKQALNAPVVLYTIFQKGISPSFSPSVILLGAYQSIISVMRIFVLIKYIDLKSCNLQDPYSIDFFLLWNDKKGYQENRGLSRIFVAFFNSAAIKSTLMFAVMPHDCVSSFTTVFKGLLFLINLMSIFSFNHVFLKWFNLCLLEIDSSFIPTFSQ